MTSTNDGKDVKSTSTSGPKGKKHYIELYKSLEAALNCVSPLPERVEALCLAWSHVHRLCVHSASSTHPHLLAWVQRHTSRTILQTSPDNQAERTNLENAINAFIKETEEAISLRGGTTLSWETLLLQRAIWFKKILPDPWGHPVLRCLIDKKEQQPSDEEVLQWLKEERGVMFVTRLRHLATSKSCIDLALLLATAVMDRVRASNENEHAAESTDKPNDPGGTLSPFGETLTAAAGFTTDVWELLTDIEFVLLHKSERTARCIELAKQCPLRTGSGLVERLRTRLDLSPSEKKLWKNAKDVATLIAQVIVARCMVSAVCADVVRTALYRCASALVHLLPRERLPAAAATLAAPAPTAHHLHTLAAAVTKQCGDTMKPFVCELYVRTITAGMNELERLKLKTEKESETRIMEKTLASWFVQLGTLLSPSARINCECLLTAFSVHPSENMFERIKNAPDLPVYKQEPELKLETETTSKFGSWANDSRGQSNFVKTSETLNLKQSEPQVNVLSTALLSEGEAMGLSAELCQDLAVLLSGPRVKTLTWDMDRDKLIENCATYMERTSGGTRTLTTELRYLNLDPSQFQHLPEDDEGEDDMYYGIEKGYEHLVELPEPEEIWADAYSDTDKTDSSCSSIFDGNFYSGSKKKKKSKLYLPEDSDPLSFHEPKQKHNKEQPHSKEKSKSKHKNKTFSRESSVSKDKQKDTSANMDKPVKVKKPRKKKEKQLTDPLAVDIDQAKPVHRLSSFIGMKVCVADNVIPTKPKTKETDKRRRKSKIDKPSSTNSDLNTQIIPSISSSTSIELATETNVVFDGIFSMDDLKTLSPEKTHSDIKECVHAANLSNIEWKSPDGIIANVSGVPKLTQVNNNNITLLSAPKGESSSKTSDTSASRALPVLGGSHHVSNKSQAKDNVRERIMKLLKYRRPKGSKSINIQSSITQASIPNQNVQESKCIISKQQQSKASTDPKVDAAMLNKNLSDTNAKMSQGEYMRTYYPQLQLNTVNEPNDMTSCKSNNPLLNSSLTSGSVIKYSAETIKHIKNQNPPISKEMALQKHTSKSDKVYHNKAALKQPIKSELKHKDVGMKAYSVNEKQESMNLKIESESIEKRTNYTNNLLKNDMFSFSNTSPNPEPISSSLNLSSLHGAKILLQKKIETVPKTFSRLSYMLKNKQVDSKHKPNVANQLKQPTEQEAISNELERNIMEYKLQKLQQQQLSISTTAYRIPNILKINNSSSSQNLQSTKTKCLNTAYSSPCITESLKSPGKLNNSTEITPSSIKSLQHQQQRPTTSSVCKPTQSLLDQNELSNLALQRNKLNLWNVAAHSQQGNRNSKNWCNKNTTKQSPNQGQPTIIAPINISKENMQNKLCRPTPTSTVVSNPSCNTTLKTYQNCGINLSMGSKISSKMVPKMATNSTSGETCTEKDTLNIASTSGDSSLPVEPVQNWETVMNAIRAQKTPSRGPNALDLVLGKNNYKNNEKSVLANQRILKSMSSNKEEVQKGDRANVHKELAESKSQTAARTMPASTVFSTSSFDKHNQKFSSLNRVIKPVLQSHKPNTLKITQAQSEAVQKQSKQLDKIFNSIETKQHQKPYSNAQKIDDYALLDELIKKEDMDLYREIHDLSSEEEALSLSDDLQLKSSSKIIDRPPLSQVMPIEPNQRLNNNSKQIPICPTNSHPPFLGVRVKYCDAENKLLTNKQISIKPLVKADMVKSEKQLKPDHNNAEIRRQIPAALVQQNTFPTQQLYNIGNNNIIVSVSETVKSANLNKVANITEEKSSIKTQIKDFLPVTEQKHYKTYQNDDLIIKQPATSFKVQQNAIPAQTFFNIPNSNVITNDTVNSVNSNKVLITAVPFTANVSNVVLITPTYPNVQIQETQMFSPNLCNVNQSTYLVNTAPNIALFQSTQYAAPHINHIIIGNASTETTSKPFVSDTSLSEKVIEIENVKKNDLVKTLTMSQSKNIPDKDESKSKTVTVRKDQFISNHNQKVLTKIICKDEWKVSNNVICSEQKSTDHVTYNNERKVLSEVQAKFTVEAVGKLETKFLVDKSITDLIIAKGVEDEENCLKDTERLKRKRQAILDRDINQRCYYPPIPLKYEPLKSNRFNLKKNVSRTFLQNKTQSRIGGKNLLKSTKCKKTKPSQVTLPTHNTDLLKTVIPSNINSHDTLNKSSHDNENIIRLLKSKSMFMDVKPAESDDAAKTSKQRITSKGAAKMDSNSCKTTIPLRVSKRISNIKLLKDNEFEKSSTKTIDVESDLVASMVPFDIEAELLGSKILKTGVVDSTNNVNDIDIHNNQNINLTHHRVDTQGKTQYLQTEQINSNIQKEQSCIQQNKEGCQDILVKLKQNQESLELPLHDETESSESDLHVDTPVPRSISPCHEVIINKVDEQIDITISNDQEVDTRMLNSTEDPCLQQDGKNGIYIDKNRTVVVADKILTPMERSKLLTDDNIQQKLDTHSNEQVQLEVEETKQNCLQVKKIETEQFSTKEMVVIAETKKTCNTKDNYVQIDKEILRPSEQSKLSILTPTEESKLVTDDNIQQKLYTPLNERVQLETQEIEENCLQVKKIETEQLTTKETDVDAETKKTCNTKYNYVQIDKEILRTSEQSKLSILTPIEESKLLTNDNIQQKLDTPSNERVQLEAEEIKENCLQVKKTETEPFTTKEMVVNAETKNTCDNKDNYVQIDKEILRPSEQSKLSILTPTEESKLVTDDNIQQKLDTPSNERDQLEAEEIVQNCLHIKKVEAEQLTTKEMVINAETKKSCNTKDNYIQIDKEILRPSDQSKLLTSSELVQVGAEEIKQHYNQVKNIEAKQFTKKDLVIKVDTKMVNNIKDNHIQKENEILSPTEQSKLLNGDNTQENFKTASNKLVPLWVKEIKQNSPKVKKIETKQVTNIEMDVNVNTKKIDSTKDDYVQINKEILNSMKQFKLLTGDNNIKQNPETAANEVFEERAKIIKHDYCQFRNTETKQFTNKEMTVNLRTKKVKIDKEQGGVKVNKTLKGIDTDTILSSSKQSKPLNCDNELEMKLSMPANEQDQIMTTDRKQKYRQIKKQCQKKVSNDPQINKHFQNATMTQQNNEKSVSEKKSRIKKIGYVIGNRKKRCATVNMGQSSTIDKISIDKPYKPKIDKIPNTIQFLKQNKSKLPLITAQDKNSNSHITNKVTEGKQKIVQQKRSFSEPTEDFNEEMRNIKEGIKIVNVVNLPSENGEPSKTSVRIKLPNGKSFKITLFGDASVNYDTLFADRAMQSIILSNWTECKRFRLNIKHNPLVQGALKVVNTEEVKIDKAPENPANSRNIETVDLISDEDEDKTTSFNFKTEFGIYKTSGRNINSFKSHQMKLGKKCCVKLIRLPDTYFVKNKDNLEIKINESTVHSGSEAIHEINKTSQNILSTHSSVDCVGTAMNKAKVERQNINLDENEDRYKFVDELTIRPEKVMKLSNINKTAETITSEIIKDVNGTLIKNYNTFHKSTSSKIPDLIKHNSDTYKNVSELIELSDSSNDELCYVERKSSNVSQVVQNTLPHEPNAKIDELKSLLLNDLCVESEIIIPDIEERFIETKVNTPKKVNDERLCHNCFVKLKKCDYMFNECKSFGFVTKKCLVKLFRCDHLLTNETECINESDSELFLDMASTKDKASSYPRSESPSIFNIFTLLPSQTAEFTGIKINAVEFDGQSSSSNGRTSPVMEVYEQIAKFTSANMTNKKPTKQLGYSYFIKCDSEWFSSKYSLRLYHDFLQTNTTKQVPTLIRISLNYLNKSDLNYLQTLKVLKKSSQSTSTNRPTRKLKRKLLEQVSSQNKYLKIEDVYYSSNTNLVSTKHENVQVGDISKIIKPSKTIIITEKTDPNNLNHSNVKTHVLPIKTANLDNSVDTNIEELSKQVIETIELKQNVSLINKETVHNASLEKALKEQNCLREVECHSKITQIPQITSTQALQHKKFGYINSQTNESTVYPIFTESIEELKDKIEKQFLNMPIDSNVSLAKIDRTPKIAINESEKLTVRSKPQSLEHLKNSVPIKTLDTNESTGTPSSCSYAENIEHNGNNSTVIIKTNDIIQMPLEYINPVEIDIKSTIYANESKDSEVEITPKLVKDDVKDNIRNFHENNNKINTAVSTITEDACMEGYSEIDMDTCTDLSDSIIINEKAGRYKKEKKINPLLQETSMKVIKNSMSGNNDIECDENVEIENESPRLCFINCVTNSEITIPEAKSPDTTFNDDMILECSAALNNHLPCLKPIYKTTPERKCSLSNEVLNILKSQNTARICNEIPSDATIVKLTNASKIDESEFNQNKSVFVTQPLVDNSVTTLKNFSYQSKIDSTVNSVTSGEDINSSEIILKGIEYEDPVVGTCYVFRPIEDSNSEEASYKTNEDGINEDSEFYEIIQLVNDDEAIEITNPTSPTILVGNSLMLNKDKQYEKDCEETEFHVMPSQRTYKINHLKRKLCMKDVKCQEKKYRKGKNIDYPKLSVSTISDSSYRKEYNRIMEYIDTVDFSYSRPYHKEVVDVDDCVTNWPILGSVNAGIFSEIELEPALFNDIDNCTSNNRSHNPLDQTLMEEISSVSESYADLPSFNDDQSFNTGFGEGSGRVTQNLKGEGDISKFSAATLSDVKQTQPFLLSEDYEHFEDGACAQESTKAYQMDKFKHYIQLKEKVRAFFKKIKGELNLNAMEQFKVNRKNMFENDSGNILKNVPGMYGTDFITPPVLVPLVQVVQVGQLPVSAAAQNPIMCDPRVTQVSEASPSQCSVENSPNGDNNQGNIKAEYTELTNAELSLPLVQDLPISNSSITLKSQDKLDGYSELDDKSRGAEIKSEDIESLEHTEKEHPIQNKNNILSENNQQKTDTFDRSSNNEASQLSSCQNVYNSGTPSDSVEVLPQKQENGLLEKTDQIAHAMNAAGITTSPESTQSTTRTHPLVNIISQKVIRAGTISTGQTLSNTFNKTSINAMALQQALAQILPPPLNQTSGADNGQQVQGASVTPQVLHIVQGKNASGNQITLVDNTQQSVINTPNATQLLHIVQNKASSGTNANGSQNAQGNTFGGLSLVDTGLQQGGNQLLHIVNTGNQKNPNAGQLLKRVNLLTNLTNAQGGNEQKMVQFVCKSADGKAIHLNAPHQRSMVLRLQPIESPQNVQTTITKSSDPQDLSPSQTPNNTLQNKESSANQGEIKSRSIYEENYAKFIQSSSNKATMLTEKSTSLPKFNQAFGKPVFQDGTPKSNETSSNTPINQIHSTDNNDCPQSDSNINLEQINQINSPPLLLRKTTAPTSNAQSNLVQQIKQTIAPMNIQTMHGGVIYTRQIPVNIGGGQTINLITVPSTELIDESSQKQQTDVKFVSQNDIEPSIIKIVPQNQSTTDGNQDENSHVNENAQTPQPQVLTQMRIKLPMLSKTPQVVPGARVVRPSFFQIQRNVIGGANQPVYQQLVLTAAPPLGQQTLRLPQTQTRQVKVPSEAQSSPESQLSSSTLEQLREFDMVLEQVKERSTVQPSGGTSNAFTKLLTQSSDSTDSVVTASHNTTDHTQQVLYSIGTTSTMNVAYVNRKSTVTTPTTSTFVRSPDSSGIVDSPSSTQMSQIVAETTTSSETSQPKAAKIGSKSVKSRPSKLSTHTPNAMKVNHIPPKTNQKPLEDEQTTQRILYILAEYKEQVENSPDKDKPAPRRRSNPPSNPSGSSKRKKSSSGSRRPGCTRDHSPITGDDACRTMGSEDSSCGTSQGDCTESCSMDTHSPQDSPRKVARKLFEPETPVVNQPRPQPPRNVIVADGQTITVARTTGKPTTAVLMPANYLLPVSMMKGGQQIAIVTNRGPKLLTVGGSTEGGAANALLLQRLIGPAGLKPVLTRPGVRHVRLPTAALHNLQAFNIASAAPSQPPDSSASPAPAPTPPELIDTRATSSPWADREASESKLDRSSSPEGSETWHLQSAVDPPEYTYEEPVAARSDANDRTVLDPIQDRYSPDMEAQRIFDKMFDVDAKKPYIVDGHDDSPRVSHGYDIDASHSDCDEKSYHQVVQKKDGSTHGLHRVAHISSAALRHKYAILEHELRLQKSLSEECEDLGVDSPSASELFPEAELLFAASPAHEHAHEHSHGHTHTPQPLINQTNIPQPDIDDQIATDHLMPVNRENEPDHQQELADVNLGLGDVGIVTVSEDGLQTTIALDQEEFARSHPNTTFHSEPTDNGEEVQPFSISTSLKSRHITSAIYHSNSAPATVLMTAPQQTVISQASGETSGGQSTNVKYSEIDNMIHNLPSTHTNQDINLSSVLVKDDGLTRFDNILTDSRELHLSNTASAIVHSGNVTQVIRRVCYDDRNRERFLMDETDALIAGDDAKMAVAEDSSRDATLESMGGDEDGSSPERQTELFWESNSASERSESRRPLDYSSDSDKCCKSPSLDETNSTDSSSLGTHLRLDSVIKEARGRERSGSVDGSSADDTTHPPIRTYPPKRSFHNEGEMERSLSGKTRAGERSSPDSPEVRRRASGRGVVKRGCHCCNGSSAPTRPKKPRQRKPTLDFTTTN